MKWSFHNAKQAFPSFRRQWDELNGCHYQAHILLDSIFVGALLDHFPSEKVVLAEGDDGDRKALALLAPENAAAWSTYQPSQSPLGLFLTPPGTYALESLQKSLPGFAGQFSVLQQDPAFTFADPAALPANIEVVPYIDTPYLRLENDFETYWSARSKNLRHNLDRQHRRLRESGRKLELVSRKAAGDMAGCIREYARLESAGWKAMEGTAVSEDNDQGRFYLSILRQFADRGEAIVYQLYLDGAIVATDLCLRRNKMLVVLKTTYDEQVEKLSPALLMRREIVRSVYEDGNIEVIEFYGRLRDWHTQWMTGARKMFHLNSYRYTSIMHAKSILKRLKRSPIGAS